jgi:hypothetical protein
MANHRRDIPVEQWLADALHNRSPQVGELVNEHPELFE